MKYLAAAVQCESKLLDREYNVAHLEEWTRKAAAMGAKLIVLPEMGTSGYYFASRAEAESVAEEIPNGPTVQRFIALAKELDCYIVVCLPMKEGRRMYNSCALVGPEGYWGHCRKMHPFTPDTYWAKNGDKPVEVFDTPIGRIAMLICMDVSFPESVRMAAVKGAQVVCAPSNWCEPQMPSSIWMTRAYENQVVMVCPNRHGVEKGFEFSGGSAVIGQGGIPLAVQREGEGVALAMIDPEARDDNGEIAARRPELYTGLQLSQYHWPNDQMHTTYASPTIGQGGTVKTFAGQFQPVKGEPQANLEKVKTMAAQAAAEGGKLLVLPELALTGRPETLQEAQAFAVEAGSPLLQQLAETAAWNGLTLVCGFVLKEDGALYNAAGLYTAAGESLIYRKSHLIPSEEAWAKAGDTPGAWLDVEGSRIGILLGSEVWVTELPRVLSNDGCDVIAIPADLEKCCLGQGEGFVNDTHWHIVRVRGNENNTFFAFANSRGRSGVFHYDMFCLPFNEALAPAEGEALVSKTLVTTPILWENGVGTPNPIRNKMMLSTRQPAWYDVLFEN
ncbi:MAG: hypothetical protein IIV90_00090 [Oscillospiraceae bacterium]|nr:hypothetical protein [Oscillospiraceae bacterium]